MVMEVRTRHGSEGELELDSELDTVGIILDRQMVCGYCMKKMERVGKNLYRCPGCGMTYEGI
jgi:tRNA(Ile2) C34 agmatinyltransferase TiaS